MLTRPLFSALAVEVLGVKDPEGLFERDVIVDAPRRVG